MMQSDPHALRVLIVDDDVQILELLADYLQVFDMDVETSVSADGVIDLIERTRVDIVVLDIMMPGTNGLSLCRKIRQISAVPVIMLSARRELADRVVGLELGADDYMTKPFEPRELVARIQTLLRRSRALPANGHGLDGIDHLAFNGWRLDRTLRQLTSPKRLVISLSNAEFRLLWAFVERPRQLLTREQLLDAARGRNAEAFDRSIDLLVSRLRQKLGDNPRNPALIKMVRGEGYLFDARIET